LIADELALGLRIVTPYRQPRLHGVKRLSITQRMQRRQSNLDEEGMQAA
jgi:hypothetical protein